jgi:hypothetical protein
MRRMLNVFKVPMKQRMTNGLFHKGSAPQTNRLLQVREFAAQCRDRGLKDLRPSVGHFAKLSRPQADGVEECNLRPPRLLQLAFICETCKDVIWELHLVRVNLYQQQRLDMI